MTDGWRPHIESALCLGLPAMMRSGAIARGSSRSGSWHWSRNGEQVASIGYVSRVDEAGRGELILQYTVDAKTKQARSLDYPVRIESQPMHFGGQRLWLICPYTGRRALKLYKFSGIDKFCCRTAIRPLPTYSIQRAAKTDLPMERQWAIRRKLRDPGNCLDPLTKPKRMRWKTFERYEAKDRQLDFLGAQCLIRCFGLKGFSQ